MRPGPFLGMTLLLLSACGPSAPPPEEATSGAVAPEAGPSATPTLRRSYYPNGGVKAEVGVIDGMQHGTLKEYYPDGRPKAVQEWQHGKAIGHHQVFDAQGSVVYHALSAYEDFEGKQFLGYAVLVNDTTKVFSTANRVVITDLQALRGSVSVTPRQGLRFGVDNAVRIEVPNIPSFSPSVRNGTLSKGQQPDAWVIRPTVAGRDVTLTIIAHVNDTTIEFEPVELEVLREGGV